MRSRGVPLKPRRRAGRRLAVAALALESLVAARTAGAQSLPFPWPPLPPPSSDVGPINPPEPSPPAPDAGATAVAPHADRDFEAAMRRASTASEREALRRSRSHESWYGWQTLAIDATAAGILLLGASFTTAGPPRLDTPPDARPHDRALGLEPLAFVGAAAAAYGLAPAVHFAHGNTWQGFASLGLRVALPVVGFALGALVARVSRSDGATDGVVGGLLGGVAAVVTDACALGRQRWVDAERDSKMVVFRVRAPF